MASRRRALMDSGAVWEYPTGVYHQRQLLLLFFPTILPPILGNIHSQLLATSYQLPATYVPSLPTESNT